MEYWVIILVVLGVLFMGNCGSDELQVTCECVCPAAR